MRNPIQRRCGGLHTVSLVRMSASSKKKSDILGSAAVGKAGAAVGTQVFTPIQNNLGKRWTFIIAAICGISGILVTYFFVPDMTGKDLAEEDAKFLQYLAENGQVFSFDNFFIRNNLYF